MVREVISPSARNTGAPSELEDLSRLPGAVRVRPPTASVTLRAETVKTLVSWGLLSCSVLDSVPCNGLAVLNGPRSLHLRSGIGVAEILTVAKNRRGSRHLPQLRPLCHTTDPASFCTNWRALWPYVEDLGIRVGESWKRAILRGEAEVVGRLVDLIIERQKNYESNVLAYDSKPFSVSRATYSVAQRGCAIELARWEAALLDSAACTSSDLLQQAKTAVTLVTPDTGAVAAAGLSAGPVEKGAAFADEEQTVLQVHKGASLEGDTSESFQTAGSFLGMPSDAERLQHNQSQHAQCNQSETLRARVTSRREPLSRCAVEPTQDTCAVPPPTRVPREAPEMGAGESQAEVGVAGGLRLKQAECETERRAVDVALASSVQQPLPLRQSDKGSSNSSRNENTLLLQYLAEVLFNPLRESSTIVLHSEEPCHDGDGLFYPLVFSSAQYPGLAAPSRMESDKFQLKQVPFEQQQGESASHQQEQHQQQPHVQEAGGNQLETCLQFPNETMPFSKEKHGASEPRSLMDAQKAQQYHQEGRGSNTIPVTASVEPEQRHGLVGKPIGIRKVHRRQRQHEHDEDLGDDGSAKGGGNYDHYEPADWSTASAATAAAPNAAARTAMTTEKLECQRASVSSGGQSSRRRTSSIFKAAGEAWGYSKADCFCYGVTDPPDHLCQQQQEQPNATDLFCSADVLQQSGSVREGKCRGAWQQKGNIEEVLLQSLKVHFGCSRKTSIHVVQQKGKLLSALFAAEGPEAVCKGLQDWIAGLKRSAPVAAERLESEPQKAGIVMQIFYNGVMHLFQQGLLNQANAMLEALDALLQWLRPTSLPLQRRLLDHLRRSTGANIVAQILATVAEADFYVRTEMTSNLLASIGSLCLLWGRGTPTAIWSGGFLRKALRNDYLYFLLAHVLLQQQQQQLQNPNKHFAECKEFLQLEFLQALAMEACSAALEQQYPVKDRAAALLVLGPLSRCCSSLNPPAEDKGTLRLMQQLIGCIRMAIMSAEPPALRTAAREALLDFVVGASEMTFEALVAAILEDGLILEALLPAADLASAAERGVCCYPSVLAALTAAITASRTVYEGVGSLDSRKLLSFLERHLKAASKVGADQAALCRAFFAHPSISAESATALLQAVFSVHTRKVPISSELLCSLIVTCWRRHGAYHALQQATRKLLFLDRLELRDGLDVDTADCSRRASSEDLRCLALSVKAYISEAPEETLLNEENDKALVSLCEECLLELATDEASQFASLFGVGALSTLRASAPGIFRPLQDWQQHPGEAPMATQEGGPQKQQECDFEMSSSTHWLDGIVDPANSASVSRSACSTKSYDGNCDRQHPATLQAQARGEAVTGGQGKVHGEMVDRKEVFVPPYNLIAAKARRIPHEKSRQENTLTQLRSHRMQQHNCAVIECSSTHVDFQKSHILHRSLVATLQASQNALSKGDILSESGVAAATIPLEEIECKLLLHYFRPVFLKLFELVQASAPLFNTLHSPNYQLQ
ncbi:hypothetical protein Efla_004039 [Eimeria flavescens]